MATLIKFLAQIRVRHQSFTEVHYRNSVTDTPSLGLQAENYLTNIAPLRAALLGKDAAIEGLRVSYRDPTSIKSWSQNFEMLGNQDQPVAEPFVSLDFKFRGANNTRQKWVYLRGIWDSVEEDANYTPAKGIGWQDKLDAWKNALIANAYGWPGVDDVKSKKGVVSTFASNVNGTVTFTTDFDFSTVMANGSRIQVSIARLNNSHSVLNRTHIVYTNGTELTTAVPTAAGAFESKGTFRYRVVFPYLYTSGDPMHIGKRSAGRHFFDSPGRLGAKPRS